jgi:hypothetical protein
MASRFARPTRVQSLLMPRSRFRTPAAACTWAENHGFKCPAKIDTTARFHRLRQAAPVACTGGTLRTIPFGKGGIKAVICSPKRGRKRAFQGLDGMKKPRRGTPEWRAYHLGVQMAAADRYNDIYMGDAAEAEMNALVARATAAGRHDLALRHRDAFLAGRYGG